MCEYLQGDSTNLLLAQSALEATCVILQCTQQSNYSQSLSKLITLAETKVAEYEAEKITSTQGTHNDKKNGDKDKDVEKLEIEFQSVTFNKLKEGLTCVYNTEPKISQRLNECISTRFSDVLADSSDNLSTSSTATANGTGLIAPIIGTIKILDTKTWPTERSELYKYGDNELKLLLNHFELIMKEKIAAPTASSVSNEWLELKLYVFDHMKHLSSEDCWAVLSKGTAFKNVMKIINILRIFPVFNAVVERCFSTMTKVKTDWRNRLGEKEVEHLIRIKKEGPPPSSTEAKVLIDKAVDRFFKTKPR